VLMCVHCCRWAKTEHYIVEVLFLLSVMDLVVAQFIVGSDSFSNSFLFDIRIISA
jgi:hypothetical protein